MNQVKVKNKKTNEFKWVKEISCEEFENEFISRAKVAAVIKMCEINPEYTIECYLKSGYITKKDIEIYSKDKEEYNESINN